MIKALFLFTVLLLIPTCINCIEDKSRDDISYLLYDVNPPEGFNLRRDVYLRIAVLIKHLNDLGLKWKLVLPPWGNMYHWKSKDVGKQQQLPWGMFFDIESMSKFIPVIEMYQFLKEYGKTNIDKVIYFQHFTNMWKDGKWEEKMSIEPCQEESTYYQSSNGKYKGWFWGYQNITSSSVDCLSFQGTITTLVPFLINITENENIRSIMVDRAEIALHHLFGDSLYWQARRSMRFSKKLINIANDFRKLMFESIDRRDKTIRPDDWRDEKKLNVNEERGGNYLCVHLRRQDFIQGRQKSVPSIIGAAAQISKICTKNKFKKIFLATDGTEDEIKELKSYLGELKLVRFEADKDMRKDLKDGGLAIVEQIICSHAKLFYGTYESTFSFRIQEEREIMGFNPDTTFNRLCGDDEVECNAPSKWKIEF